MKALGLLVKLLLFSALILGNVALLGGLIFER